MILNADLHAYGWLTFERPKIELPGISYRGPRSLQTLVEGCERADLDIIGITNFGDRRYEQLRETASQLPSDYSVTDLPINDRSVIVKIKRQDDPKPWYVVRGQQVLTKEGHITVLGSPRQLQDGRLLEESIQEAKDTGALVFAVNPLARQGRGGEVTPGLETYMRQIPVEELGRNLDRCGRHYDALQFFSASAWPASIGDLLHYSRFYEKAKDYVRRSGLPGIAVSEAHALSHLGTAYISFDERLLDDTNARHFLDSLGLLLRQRRFTVAAHQVSRLSMARCLAADLWNHFCVKKGLLDIRRE